MTLILLVLTLACTRPDGSDNPQLQSPFLLATPTSVSTPIPSPIPSPTATVPPTAAATPTITLDLEPTQAPPQLATPTPAPSSTAEPERGDPPVPETSPEPPSEEIPAAPESATVFDTLSGSGSLAGRQPQVGPEGVVWEEEVGDWFITADGVGENSGLNADLRAFLKVSEPPRVVSVDIQLSGGLAGLVLRYAADTKWLMVWFNDEINTLAAGALNEGTFTQILSVPYVWETESGFRSISIVDQDGSLIVLVDGLEIASVDVPDGFDGTGVGIFNRGGTNNLFRNFATEGSETEQ